MFDSWMRLLDEVSITLEAKHQRIQGRGMIVDLVTGNASRTWAILVRESFGT